MERFSRGEIGQSHQEFIADDSSGSQSEVIQDQPRQHNR